MTVERTILARPSSKTEGGAFYNAPIYTTRWPRFYAIAARASDLNSEGRNLPAVQEALDLSREDCAIHPFRDVKIEIQQDRTLGAAYIRSRVHVIDPLDDQTSVRS